MGGRRCGGGRKLSDRDAWGPRGAGFRGFVQGGELRQSGSVLGPAGRVSGLAGTGVAAPMACRTLFILLAREGLERQSTEAQRRVADSQQQTISESD
jgi:hypothetical protein